jgi:hypothetical protein
MPLPLSSPRRLLGRLTARHRLAALAALVMLAVATPLAEVWQRQARELELLLGARAVLDPVARAFDGQRALISHRETAHQVLRGRHELEPERQFHQGEVDRRLSALAVALRGGARPAAVDECEALREGWLALSTRVSQRRIDAAGSDSEHRLLVEQVLQVIDLLTSQAAPPPAAAGPGGPLWSLLGRTLPRAEAAWAGEDRQAQRAAAAALARAWTPPEGSVAVNPALVKARAAALAALRASSPAGDGAVDRTAARQRLAEWTSVVQASLRAELEAQIGAVEADRRQQALVMGLLGTLAAALWLGLWRAARPAPRGRDRAAHPAEPASGASSASPSAPPEAESRVPAQRAIERARQSDLPTSASAPPDPD